MLQLDLTIMRVMPRRRWPIFLAALALGGCSWLPFSGADTGEVTNPAVVACLRQADADGLAVAGERQATPAGAGRYAVILDVRGDAGYHQVTCAYDPGAGAVIDKAKQAGS